MQKVQYSNKSITIVANLYLPKEFDADHHYPVIICGHPVGGVKEQTAGLYAKKLSEQGFITIAFDAGYHGESTGLPRFLEDPYARIEDFRATIDYLYTLPYIDPENIIVLGICGAGGYAITSAITDHRIKAVIGISMVNIGDMYRNGWDGHREQINECLSILEDTAKRRSSEVINNCFSYSPWAPASLEDAENADMHDAYIYYHTERAMHPNAPSKGIAISAATIIGYDAFHLADQFLTQPILMIVGSEAKSQWHSQRIIQKTVSRHKMLHIIDGANHIDLYDNQIYINRAIQQIMIFLEKMLFAKNIG